MVTLAYITHAGERFTCAFDDEARARRFASALCSVAAIVREASDGDWRGVSLEFVVGGDDAQKTEKIEREEKEAFQAMIG